MWRFKHGSRVKADTFADAVRELSTCRAFPPRVFPTDPGAWDVIFGAVLIEVRCDGSPEDAVAAARWSTFLDSREQELI
jgi:hypothetical protein